MSATEMTLTGRMVQAQSRLKAKKTHWNEFGAYSYRSVEDILEKAKPILLEMGLCLNISDDIKIVGDRYYVVSTAEVWCDEGTNKISSCGIARESVSKKKLDESQITGLASGYARKRALEGLFALDNTGDSDALPPDTDGMSITDAELDAINGLLDGSNDPNKRANMVKYFGVQKVEDLTQGQYKEAVQILRRTNR